MSRRHIIFHNTATPEGRTAFWRAYNAKHGLNLSVKQPRAARRVAKEPSKAKKQVKLPLCAQTGLESHPGKPAASLFKPGKHQRVHLWPCDHCHGWHGDLVFQDPEIKGQWIDK